MVLVDRFDHLTQADLEILVALDLRGIQMVLQVQEVHLILTDPDCPFALVAHLVHWDQATLDSHLDPEVPSNLCLRVDLKIRMVLAVLVVLGVQMVLVVRDFQRDQEVQGCPVVLMGQMVQLAL